jgi:hypothetical protein
MGILDGIVEWIAEQVMNILDLITTSVLGALGCSMDTFLRYFPAAETMYQVFLALGIGLILLNWVWQLFKNYFMGAGIEAEDPIKLSIRSFLFIFLTFYAKDIVDLLLKISGTPYNWILTEDLPPLKFADFNSVVTVILGVCANGAVAIIALILVLILAWNYIKLLFEAAERYILLGVLVYTAPAAFHGCQPVNRKYLQKLVPDAWRPVLFASDECVVPAAVYFYGRHLPCQSVIPIRKEDQNET